MGKKSRARMAAAGTVVILIAWLMRAVRLPVPIRRKRLGRMLILSGRLI